MNLKDIISKMTRMAKEEPPPIISAVTEKEEGTSDDEARDAASRDTQHYINQYAKFAFAFSDRVLEELESEAHDPYWQAQIENILARRQALQVALAEYNDRCEEENSPRSTSL